MVNKKCNKEVERNDESRIQERCGRDMVFANVRRHLAEFDPDNICHECYWYLDMKIEAVRRAGVRPSRRNVLEICFGGEMEEEGEEEDEKVSDPVIEPEDANFDPVRWLDEPDLWHLQPEFQRKPMVKRGG